MGTAISDSLRNLFVNDAVQTVSIAVTPTEGSPFTITSSDIVFGTFMIDRSVMEGTSLNLGSCVASELSMTLENADKRFSSVKWNGAELVVSLGAEGSNETLPMGVFYVDGTPKTRQTVTITALDGMTKFDKAVYDPDEFWLDEWTLGDIVSYCCSKCGVTLATDITGFPNTTYEFSIGNPIQGYARVHPDFTYRVFLSYAVAIMGKCAWMNADGELEIGFATNPRSTQTPAIAGVAIVGKTVVGSSYAGNGVETFYAGNRFSSDYDNTIYRDGVKFVKASTAVTYISNDGDTVYDFNPFDLTGNLILDLQYGISGGGEHTLQDVVNNIYSRIYTDWGDRAFNYLPFVAEATPHPYMFPFDPVLFENDSNFSRSFATNITFRLNGTMGVASQGEQTLDDELAPIPSLGVVKSEITVIREFVDDINSSMEFGNTVTVTKKLNANVGLQINGTDVIDFPIEQGTSNGWFYRKWNSGRYECWYRSPSNVSVACTTAWGSTLYYGQIATINFPITFIDYPVMSVTVQAGAGGAWAAPDYPSKSATGPIYMYRPTSSTVNCLVNVYAQGRWQ